MTRALLISVRFHDDRYHGAGDWPPSPARLFQALVSAAAKPGLEQTSCDALTWLEQLDAPVIAAPAAHSGQHVSLFVPNNDLDAKGGDIRRVAEIRSATKHIRPRLFDASVPLLYVWRFDAKKDSDQPHAECVCKIADGLYQLGRGVDMAWAIGEVLDEADAETRLAEYRGVIYRPSEKGQGTALDCPEEDSLESLVIRHQAGAQRFHRVQDGRTVRTEFANAPKPRFRSVAYNSLSTRLLFDLRRTTAPGSPFAPWPLKSAAALVQKLRGNDGADGQPKSGAFAKLVQHFDAGMVSKALIGRGATEADKALRIRIIPLPSIGHEQADKSIRRVLVEVPPDSPIRADDVAWAFSNLEVESPEIDADGVIVSSPVELVAADDDSMLEHYGLKEGTPSRLWYSVTPLALPESAARRRIDPIKRHGQEKNGAECLSEHQRACDEVAQVLRHAGLRYRIANLHVQREPFEAKGKRAEAFASGTRFSKHQLWHVKIEFTEPVSGPIVLGNGRYLGLGLMAPLCRTEGLFSFSIIDGLSAYANPMELARALRRAVMARVQATLGKAPLPLFFTGHERNGDPARGNVHQHLAFVADLPRDRLLIVAPHMMEHRQPVRDEKEHLSVLAASLAGLTELRAGAAGKLELTRSVVYADDPLLTPALRWESVTEYRVTRHPKKAMERDALIADTMTELARRNLPRPMRIDAIQCKTGPHGGVTGRMRIEFATAVSGPILIGQTCHSGGGLFAPVLDTKQNELK